MILGALLHVVLPVVAVIAVVLLVIGRTGRRFVRILLLGAPGRRMLDRRAIRLRIGATVAVGLGALCAVKAAETAATTQSQVWLVWTMASIAALLVLGGGGVLVVTGRRRAAADRPAREPVERR